MKYISSLLALAAIGCATEDEARLSVQLTNLEPLGDSARYEGWIIVDGQPVSTGRFQDPSAGLSFDVDATGATKFILSIEPQPDNDPGPAPTKILAGEFTNGTATLSIAELGNDFASAAGKVTLATPTTANDTNDETQGIWFLDMSSGSPMAALTLPTLPAGWVYEGWVVTDDGPRSTGRFTKVDEADSDGKGATAGPDGAPPFPGQDYINPAIDLVGKTAVVSVEPEPDDTPAPFAFKPLALQLAADIAPNTQTLQQNVSQTVPSGTVTIE